MQGSLPGEKEVNPFANYKNNIHIYAAIYIHKYDLHTCN